MQAHEVGRDDAVAARPAREHDRAAHLVQGRALLARQQRQRALERGKVDLARPLRIPCRLFEALLSPRLPACSKALKHAVTRNPMRLFAEYLVVSARNLTGPWLCHSMHSRRDTGCGVPWA